MGLFSKIKNIFGNKENVKVQEEIKNYDTGLKKSREEFVSQLANLSKKYKIFHNFLSVGIDTSGLYTLDDTMKSLILNPKITYNYPLNNLEKDLE